VVDRLHRAGAVLVAKLSLGALALNRFVASLLYGVTPTDPMVYAALVLLLGTVSLVALLGPVRRATRVDPSITLRAE